MFADRREENTMSSQFDARALPTDLEAIFTLHANEPLTLMNAFMPVFCNHVGADRIFLQPRNPDTRVCKVIKWRSKDSIPWYEVTARM